MLNFPFAWQRIGGVSIELDILMKDVIVGRVLEIPLATPRTLELVQMYEEGKCMKY